MKILLAAALLVSAVLVQVTWAPALTVAGAFPNLVLLMVVGVTWIKGVRVGMAWACAGGVVLDLTAPGPLGPHALALLGGAYVTGFWARNFDQKSFLHPVIAAVIATGLYCLTLLAADDMLGLPVPTFAVAWELAVAAAAYNAAAMLAVLFTLRVGRPARFAVLTGVPARNARGEPR